MTSGLSGRTCGVQVRLLDSLRKYNARLEDYPSGGECQGRSLTHLSSLVCDHDQRAVSRAVRRLIAATCIAGIVAKIRSYVPLLCASEVSCAFWITLLHLSRLSRNAAPKIESCRLPLPVACTSLSYGRFAFPTPQSEPGAQPVEGQPCGGLFLGLSGQCLGHWLRPDVGSWEGPHYSDETPVALPIVGEGPSNESHCPQLYSRSYRRRYDGRAMFRRVQRSVDLWPEGPKTVGRDNPPPSRAEWKGEGAQFATSWDVERQQRRECVSVHRQRKNGRTICACVDSCHVERMVAWHGALYRSRDPFGSRVAGC